MFRKYSLTLRRNTPLDLKGKYLGWEENTVQDSGLVFPMSKPQT